MDRNTGILLRVQEAFCSVYSAPKASGAAAQIRNLCPDLTVREICVIRGFFFRWLT